jgi:hypothetical protein
MGPLDSAIADAAAKEATYSADLQNVSSIQISISQASSGLVPAQAQLATDAKAYNDSLDALISAATAAKVTIPNSPPAS